MRRLAMLLLVAAPILPGRAALGQSTVSLYGGLNLTTLADALDDPDFVVPYERIAGLQVGLGTTFRFGPSYQLHRLGVQLNGTYSQMGSGYVVFDRYTRVRLNYLGLSALFDMRLPFLWERLATRFTFGPAVGWMLSCERHDEGTEDAFDRTSPCIDTRFRTLDYGMIFGGGLEMGMTNRLGITAGLHFHWGARDIETDPARTFTRTRLLNRGLALRGGLQYSIH